MPDSNIGDIGRVPRQDTRTRRALDRLRVPTAWVSGTGIYIDDSGRFAIRLNSNATLVQDANGLSANAALTALAAISTTGHIVRTGTNTFATRTIVAPSAGFTITNGSGVSGNPTFVLANDLGALEALASTGLAARTATDTWAQRTITGPAAGISVTNGNGVAGNPTLVLANDLAAVEALSSTGLAARTATDTWTVRTITGPAAGLTVTNGSGVSGNPTLSLANDLAALEGLATTGLAVRTATDTWVTRTVTGTSNQVIVTNGDGISGNPVLALPQDIHTGASPSFVGATFSGNVTAATFNKVTITAPSVGATLTIANGKTLTVSNTLAFTGADSSSVAFGTGGTVAYTSNKLSVFAATTSAELAGVITDETGTGALVFANSPSFTTPSLGVATATSINKVTITAPATGATLTLSNGSSLITSGGHSITLTSTGTTSVTLPTSGTLADRTWTLSRGMNLVTNGYGTYGNNYNFSQLTYDTTEVYAGRGSFRYSIPNVLRSDEAIPVDPNRYYRGTCWVKSTVLAANNFCYVGVECFDVEDLSISPFHVRKFPGATDTTLAADLNPGDTTMTVTDATGWYNSTSAIFRHFVWYPYTNGYGYTFPDYTYTRNLSREYYGGVPSTGTWQSGGISGNVITLTSAWTGPQLLAGTKVRNCADGNTYKYPFANNKPIPNDWTLCTGVIGGVIQDATQDDYRFSPGTAIIRFRLLANYPLGGSGNVMNFSAIHLTEIAEQNLNRFAPHIALYNSTTYFQVNAADGTVLLNVDTTNKRVGINTDSPTRKLDINDDGIRIRTAKTPASAGATGTQGDIAWDANYLYVCTATNTWRRIAHTSW